MGFKYESKETTSLSAKCQVLAPQHKHDMT